MVCPPLRGSSPCFFSLTAAADAHGDPTLLELAEASEAASNPRGQRPHSAKAPIKQGAAQTESEPWLPGHALPVLHSAETHLRALKPVTRNLRFRHPVAPRAQRGFPPSPQDRLLLLEAGLTWGTHFGETKLVASITGSPASESMSTSLIFTAVGTMFCNRRKPSKGKSATLLPEMGLSWRSEPQP